jgi:tetratricopeptide (TPR) repeat protein
MSHPGALRRVLAVLLLMAVAVSVAAQQPEGRAKNLKVLPKDMSHDDIVKIMGGFSRALGVRCAYCHVAEPGKPIKDFSLDDKPTKVKARVMMQMTQDINDKYLANLTNRAEPSIRVQCATCHHGVAQPRMLQDVLKIAYDRGGLDSTLARYHALRDRYYGAAAYDFTDVPLGELANQVRSDGKQDDAVRILELNVEMNPNAAFAKRQLAVAVIQNAYATAGSDSGAAKYHTMVARYGANVVGEDLLNEVGYRLLSAHQLPPAIAVFKLGTEEFPSSANAFDSLGEAYLAAGSKKLAVQAYQQSLTLDPTNENAQKQLQTLGAKPKAKPGHK